MADPRLSFACVMSSHFVGGVMSISERRLVTGWVYFESSSSSLRRTTAIVADLYAILVNSLSSNDG